MSTEPQQQAIRTTNFVKMAQRFQRYAHGQTDTQMDRQTDHSSPLPYRGGVQDQSMTIEKSWVMMMGWTVKEHED